MRFPVWYSACSLTVKGDAAGRVALSWSLRVSEKALIKSPTVILIATKGKNARGSNARSGAGRMRAAFGQVSWVGVGARVRWAYLPSFVGVQERGLNWGFPRRALPMLRHAAGCG